MNRALIVDDVAAGGELLSCSLSKVGFSADRIDPFAFSSSTDAPSSSSPQPREPAAFEFIARARPDVVVISHRPRWNSESGERYDAIDFVRGLRRVSDSALIVVSSVASVADCEEAMRAGANRFVLWSESVDQLGSIASELVEERRVEGANSAACTLEAARRLGERELRELLQRLIVECRGNVAEVARRMNRDRSTVRYHLRRMELLE